ncbi:MAG: UbiD family decarboxylase [Deltaproteobacteria bacterium]|nr:UbiD family decarboxylase [Deltaproteobacteria bacterium]
MKEKDVTSMRGAMEYLATKRDVLRIKEEVDPIYEIAGLAKALDKGPVLMFENIKGYAQFRNIGNFFSRRDRLADLYDLEDTKELKFRFVEALRKPLPPKVVEDAPCQEVVITDNIDVPAFLPIIKHTERDAGRILGSGIQLLMGPWFDGGTHVSFNRIHFRDKDWATLATGQISHLGEAAFKHHRDDPIPLTVNINPPPVVQMVAGTWNVRTAVYPGMDELAIAGAFQGSPVEIVKAKTVDNYAIAKAEVVLEGYLEPERAWESDEGEQSKKLEDAPFFPEWVGYLGRSWIMRKLKITAITHRKESPIFYTPLAHSLEYAGFDLLREAGFYQMAEQIVPGMVTDVYVPEYLKWGSGVIFQIRKARPQDEGFQRNILMAALSNAPGMRMVVAVDEDVDIYNADDVMWAIESRVDPDNDIFKLPRGTRGIAAQPMEVIDRGVGGWEGGMAFDATKPYNRAWRFERPCYPVHKVDLKKFLSEDQLRDVEIQQTEYAKTLARHGW